MAEEDNKRTRAGANVIIPDKLLQRAQIYTWQQDLKANRLREWGVTGIVNFWPKVDPDLADIGLDWYWQISCPRSEQTLETRVDHAAKAVAEYIKEPDRVALSLCEAGKTRSVYFCVLVVREYLGLSNAEAYAYVKERVPGLNLKGFMYDHLGLDTDKPLRRSRTRVNAEESGVVAAAIPGEPTDLPQARVRIKEPKPKKEKRVKKEKVKLVPLFAGYDDINTSHNIVCVKGTHGSAKSTVVASFIENYPHEIQYGLLGDNKPEAYEIKVPELDKPLYVLGPYLTDCGGCDAIQPYDKILELINKYADKGHVLFEGALVSSSYGRVGRLMEKWGQKATMLFLTTPLEECYNRVATRRLAKGNDRVFDTTNIRTKFEQIEGSKKKIIAQGTLRVEESSSEFAPEKILELLKC